MILIIVAQGVSVAWWHLHRLLMRSIEKRKGFELMLHLIIAMTSGLALWSWLGRWGPYRMYVVLWTTATSYSTVWFAASRSDLLDDPTRRQWQGYALVMSAIFGLTTLLLFTPLRQGINEGRELLNGVRPLPGVTVVLKEEHPMSKLVTRVRREDDRWLYETAPQGATRRGATVYSLQFIGESDDAVYLLDLGIPGVHMISRDSVLELLLVPTGP